MNAIQTLLANKHTTGAGLAFAVIKGGKHIAMSWWPHKADQIRTTADILEGIAGVYLGVSAGDAVQSASKKDVAQAVSTGNTDFLKQPDIPAH